MNQNIAESMVNSLDNKLVKGKFRVDIRCIRQSFNPDGILISLLVFVDHNLEESMVKRRDNKLVKGKFRVDIRRIQQSFNLARGMLRYL